MADKPIFDLGPAADTDSPDIGAADCEESAGARDLQHVRKRTSVEKDKRTGLLLAGGLIVVALAALIAVPLLTSSDESTQDEESEAASPDTFDVPAADAAAGQGGSDAADGGDPVPGFAPPTTEHLRSDEIAWGFETKINNDGSNYGIAYVSDGDFVVLDDRGIMLPDLEIAVDFETVAGLALLTTDGRTWAVNPADRERNYLVSNSYVVVVSERPGTIAIIRPDDRTAISLMSSALPIPSVQLPEDAGLLWVQGRGPLVMPRTGGTFEVSGIASSLTRISDDRAVAASLHGTVYESCDDSLACTYFSQIDEEPATALPFVTDDRFTISPDGAWVVASTDDLVVLFDTANQDAIVMRDMSLSAVDWAADSSFVALVDGDRLSIIYPETLETIPLRLNQAPDKDSLLVFQS